jgi:hypothetical protein
MISEHAAPEDDFAIDLEQVASVAEQRELR